MPVDFGLGSCGSLREERVVFGWVSGEVLFVNFVQRPVIRVSCVKINEEQKDFLSEANPVGLCALLFYFLKSFVDSYPEFVAGIFETHRTL